MFLLELLGRRWRLLATDPTADAKKLALEVTAKLESIERVRLFMVEDLEKTIGLASTPRGAPNFMLALALTAYTEYWGRLVTGIPSGDGDACFTAFFERLGNCYQALINDPNLVRMNQGGGKSHEVYWRIRGGLAHSYLIESNSVINLGRGSCGVEYDQSRGKYTFNILSYFDDFKNAIDKFLIELESGKADWSKFENAIKNKPELI